MGPPHFGDLDRSRADHAAGLHLSRPTTPHWWPSVTTPARRVITEAPGAHDHRFGAVSRAERGWWHQNGDHDTANRSLRSGGLQCVAVDQEMLPSVAAALDRRPRPSLCFESQPTSGSDQRTCLLTCGVVRCRLALKAKESRQAAGGRARLQNAIFLDQLLLGVVVEVLRNDLRLEYEARGWNGGGTT